VPLGWSRRRGQEQERGLGATRDRVASRAKLTRAPCYQNGSKSNERTETTMLLPSETGRQATGEPSLDWDPYGTRATDLAYCPEFQAALLGEWETPNKLADSDSC